MIQKLALASVFIIVINSKIAVASDNDRKMTKWQTTAIFQGLALAHGGLAAYDPVTMGTMEFFLPFYLGFKLGWFDKKARNFWPLYIGYLSLGIYNLTVDEDFSKTEVFFVNYAGINTILLASWLLSRKNIIEQLEQNLYTGISIKKDSIGVHFSYKF